MIKIWGTSYGLIGDLIAGLPMLTYFEKKYPKSYKYWVIQGKCAITAPLFLNHPLIDRIKITDEWSGFGEIDKKLMSECEFVARATSKHDRKDWYNYTSFIEETFKLAGIYDMKEVLTEEEQIPKLYKWFKPGIDNSAQNTYSKTNEVDNTQFNKSVAIWPFGTGAGAGRSPDPIWWNIFVDKLRIAGYNVNHYGRDSEPSLSELQNYHKRTGMSFFQQVKAALASDIVIGPDTGPMWVMGAYSHPAINLMTTYLPNHTENKLCLAPINTEAINLYIPNINGRGCNSIDPDLVVDLITKRQND